MMPSSLLPIVERCTELRELYTANPTIEWEPLWHEAFAYGVRSLLESPAEASKALAVHKAVLATLPLIQRIGVQEAVNNHLDEMKHGDIPSAHNFGISLSIDLDGDAPAKREPSIGGRADCAWQEVNPAGRRTGVVLLHRLAGVGGEDIDTLEILSLGLAWAVMNDLSHMKVGVLIHGIDRKPRYRWSPVYGDGEMQTVLARVRRSLTTPRAARVGPHCTSASGKCPALRSCAAWQLPALTEAHQALKALQAGGSLSESNIAGVRHVVASMALVSEIASARIKAYEDATRAA